MMEHPTPGNRTFISCVSNEFENAGGAFQGLRSDLRFYLARADCEVKVQEEFRDRGKGTTLASLDAYIQKCTAVIHLVGDDVGWSPKKNQVEDFLRTNPDFLQEHPDLLKDLGDFSNISATQWEAYMALHHGVSLFVYHTGNAKSLQKDHLNRLKLSWRHGAPFKARFELAGLLVGDLREIIPELPSIPSSVPRYLPARNPHFCGRKPDLEKLRNLLTQQGSTIGITQQVAVHAGGGVGKSSLALEFAWDCLDSELSPFPGGIFWLDCQEPSIDVLAEQLARFSKTLNLPGDDSSDDPFPQARKVRDHIANGPPALLILDNILNDRQWLDPNLISLLPNGSCSRIATTRASSLGDYRVPMMPLDVLTPEDARQLLGSFRKDALTNPNEDVVIQKIIHWFGGLAIGLTVVGIYMADHPDLAWSAYWKSLSSNDLKAVRQTEGVTLVADYAGRVDSVVDDLTNSFSAAEQFALYYAASLPGDDISDRWLIDLINIDAKDGYFADSTPLPGYDSYAQPIVAGLIFRGVLRRSIDSDLRKTVYLHPVVRARIRERLEENLTLQTHIADNLRSFRKKVTRESHKWRSTISKLENFEEAESLFAEMVQSGFEVDIFSFNNLMHKADRFAEALTVLDRMTEAGIPPDAVTFNILINKTDQLPDALKILEQMTKASVAPDEITFSTLISKAKDFTQGLSIFESISNDWNIADCVTFNTLMSKACKLTEALSVLKLMKGAGAVPDGFTFNILMSKAGQFSEALAILNHMPGVGVKPDIFTFTTLMKKADRFSDGLAVLEQMAKAQITPNEFTFNTLMNKANHFSETNFVLEQMTAAGVTPDKFTFNSLMNKARKFSDALSVLQHMTRTGVTPNDVTFNILMNKARKFSEANIILDHMTQVGVAPDEFTFTTLINKADQFSEAVAVLELMTKGGVAPDEYTFTTLMNKADQFSEANSVLDQMTNSGLIPNKFTFGTLMNKADRFTEAKAVFAQMIEAGLTPNEITFTTFIKKAGSFSEGLLVLEYMNEANVSSDEFIFTTLMNKAGSFSEALEILKRMTGDGVAPSVVTYTTLVKKADQFSEANSVLEQMIEAGLTPNEVTFTTLMTKADLFSEANAVLEQMIEAGLAPNEVTFTILMNKADLFSEANAVLEQMIKAGLTPNDVTFATLMNKADTFSEANNILDRMTVAGIQPGVVIFTILIKKAGQFHTALAVFERMLKEGITPNDVTTATLMGKAVTFAEGRTIVDRMTDEGRQVKAQTFKVLFSQKINLPPTNEILTWYQQRPTQFNSPLVDLINRLQRIDRYSEALVIALLLPHLAASRRVMLHFPDLAKEGFTKAQKSNPNHHSPDFALGALAAYQGKKKCAESHFKAALGKTSNTEQREETEKWIEKILRNQA